MCFVDDKSDKQDIITPTPPPSTANIPSATNEDSAKKILSEEDGETPSEEDGETPSEEDGETPSEEDGETPNEEDGETPNEEDKKISTPSPTSGPCLRQLCDRNTVTLFPVRVLMYKIILVPGTMKIR